MRLLLIFVLFAVATYLVVRALQRRGVMPERPAAPRMPKRKPPSRPVAPDDDEDFLRDLDRRRLYPEDPDSRES